MAGKTTPRTPHPPEPWLPVPFAKADAYAIKALARGEATEEQQKRALEWFVYTASVADDLSYRPGVDGDRATAFAEGRRFVGLQTLKLVNIRSDVLEKMRDG